MDKRIILVTGASRGIGRATTLALAELGDHVIALARSKAALEKLDDEVKALGGTLSLIPFDLKDKAAYQPMGQALASKFGRLDGLIANAGILGTLGPLVAMGERSFEETIEVNLTANWRLIRALDPLLQRSDTPRAVFMTSGVVPRPRAFWGPYQASKAGLEALVHAYSEENEKMALRVNLFDPGATATTMRKDAMPGEDQSTLPTAQAVASELVKLVAKTETRTGKRIAYQDLI